MRDNIDTGLISDSKSILANHIQHSNVLNQACHVQNICDDIVSSHEVSFILVSKYATLVALWFKLKK